MLEIADLEKSFKHKRVLNGVNLNVSTGELIYIKGANGSGKSTLLKIIAGIMEKDSGVLEISSDAIVGGMIENPAFIESESILYNLNYLASLNGKLDIPYTEKLCKILDIDLYSKEKMRTYSVGMRQKVGIIQSIMEHQNLILLDEPTRGLDSETAQSFDSLISDLTANGKSIILISHESYPNLVFTQSFELKEGRLMSL
jgi:ABC-2 type transport system ATP-binding protein